LDDRSCSEGKAPTLIERRLSLPDLIYKEKLRASSPKSKGGVTGTAFATRVGAVAPLRPAFSAEPDL
jgi:hypothetical protein